MVILNLRQFDTQFRSLGGDYIGFVAIHFLKLFTYPNLNSLNLP